MKLIDGDCVIAEIQKNKLLAREPASKRCVEIIENATTYVEPPVFDMEKVVEQIKSVGTSFCINVHCNSKCSDCEHGAIMRSIIDIVKKGGAE